MRLVTWLGVGMVTAALFGGCAKPCDELAELGCERAGDDSEHCAKLREQASKAGTEEQRSCRRAVLLVDTLGKNR